MSGASVETLVALEKFFNETPNLKWSVLRCITPC